MRIEYDLSAGEHIPLGLDLNFNISIEYTSNSNSSNLNHIKWDKLTNEDLNFYTNLSEKLLSEIEVPISTLNCRNFNCVDSVHISEQTRFYGSIISTLKSASSPLINENIHGRRREIPGWSDYVKSYHSFSIHAVHEWRDAGFPTTGPVYDNKIKTHKDYKSALRWAKRNEQNILSRKLAENLTTHNGKDFWKDVRKLSGKTKTTPTCINGINGDSKICNLWKEHYTGILNSLSVRDYAVGRVDFDVSAIVTAQEVHNCISLINKTKSPGPDGLSTEHFRFGPALLCELLAKCFTSFFVHGNIPIDLMDVHIVPVVKDYRGKLSSLDNYRPIAIANCTSKLIECCILSRIEEAIKATQNQFGFQKGVGTDTCIFVLKEIINKFRNSNTNSFLAFLDASKAFDRVRHDLIFVKLNKVGVPSYIIRLLKFWYSTQTMYVRWNGHLSERFGCSNGVKQGGILSPYLFNFYLNELSFALNSMHIGCTLNVNINHLLYADDLVLIAPSKKGLQQLLQICEKFALAHSILFNVKKSKFMVIKAKAYKDYDFGSIKLNDGNLEQVANFRYLGHIISDGTSDDSDIIRHCRFLYTVGNSLIRRFWFCDIRIKLKLFTMYCGNMYTGHLWHNYKVHSLNKVKTAYNSILRRLLNIPRVENGKSYSASSLFVQHNVLNFSALMRKHLNGFRQRLETCSHPSIHYLQGINRISSEWWCHYRNAMF